MIEELKKATNLTEGKLVNVDDELGEFLDLLLSNCVEDTTNANTYLINALKSIGGDNIAQAAHIMSVHEDLVQRIQNNRKLKKMGDLNQVVLPVIIMGKLLKLMQDKLK